jgi:Tfp pilus assembly protein PilX
MRPLRSRPARQDAAALVSALCVMLAVLIVGVSAARMALDAEKSASVERDRHIALQAAEAALADAEADIAGGANPASARAALLASGSAADFVIGCGGSGEKIGLCRAASGKAAPVWQAIDLAGARAVPYGRFTGASLPTGAGTLPARMPSYIIERLVLPSEAGIFYRITAMGFGARASTRAVLQSCYRKAPPGKGQKPSVLPEKRISWREVANWPELHAAAE